MNTRELLNITRGKNTNKDIYQLKEKYDIRKSLNKLRNLNEAEFGGNEATNQDQKNEEDKFKDYFSDLIVNIEFQPIEIHDNGVYFGATIDGQVQFVYKVTPDEITSGFEINYLPGFDKSNPENQDIMKRIESYYDIFFKYWRNNIL